jgi:hypothetical protein
MKLVTVSELNTSKVCLFGSLMERDKLVTRCTIANAFKILIKYTSTVVFSVCFNNEQSRDQARKDHSFVQGKEFVCFVLWYVQCVH